MGINISTNSKRRKRKFAAILSGLVIGLAITLVSLEWNSKAEKAPTSGDTAPRIEVKEQVKAPPKQVKTITPTPPSTPPSNIESQAEIIQEIESNVEAESLIITATEKITPEESSQTDIQPAEVISPVEQEEELPEQHVFEFVEEMPQYPGGNGELTSFLNRNIRYPNVALENGIHGRVTVSFTINQDGSIVDVEVLRSIDPSLDKEAKRLVSSMPKWMPGRQRGKPVRVKFAVPVHFRLQQ
ncbi:MAG: TonB family protein [Tannerella sp.]|jgi:protein TonB|nr:TonB family protein [Tannerella sp.]